MTTYIIRRVLGFIPVLLGVMLFTFVMIRSIPGGPFDTEKGMPPQVKANIEAQYHLDWPMGKQFLSYVFGDDVVAIVTGDPEAWNGASRGIIRGDFGLSLQYRGQTVADIIKTTLPTSAQLGFLSVLFAVIIGVPLGIIAALRQNTWIDYTATFWAVFFLSVSNIVLAPLLIWIFSLRLGWFPVAGWGAKPPYLLGFIPRLADWNMDFFLHAALPVFALATASAAGISRLTRATLLQVIREDYIRTARAKGLHERAVIIIHALKNSLIPVVTILGPIFAALVTGTFIIESFFGINGLGKHFVQSVTNRDYTVLLGVTLLYSTFLVVANLMVDISYAWLDPRIRYD
ncbi:MAG: ABC transporter permease [Candidatus Promineifilaceae bacterium]|nr:ABC transporter permease [Candidatus Promineifilaceae bacterium]